MALARQTDSCAQKKALSARQTTPATSLYLLVDFGDMREDDARKASRSYELC